MPDDIPRYDRDDLGLYRSNMGHWCEWHTLEAWYEQLDGNMTAEVYHDRV